MKRFFCSFRFVALVLGLSLIGLSVSGNSSTIIHQDEIPKPPSYAGFGEIKPEKNSFILVGDTQKTGLWEFWRERNDRERKLITDEIAKHDPAFVIFLGDLTVFGSSNKHWQDFDDLHQAFREKKIPCFPILGNHELYGDDKIALKNFFGRFPHLVNRHWYSFVWKNIGFILLDSNFSSLTKGQIDKQSKWYLAELNRFQNMKEVAHIIVCCHHSPFTNSRVISPSHESEVLFAGPFLRYQKARLFFSGHSHSYEKFQKDGKVFIVSGGGGGPRHKLNIDPATRAYQDQFNGPELRFFHFCEIELKGKNLILNVIRLEQDGSFILADSIRIE